MVGHLRKYDKLVRKIGVGRKNFCIPGVPKKSSGVWLNAEKKVLNLAISNQSSEMLDIST